MARELWVVWAGRHQRKGWEELCAEYRTRIGRFLPVRDVPVKVREGAGEEAARARSEAGALLAAVPSPAWLVALDRKGKAKSSEELARWLAELHQRWPHPVVFVVGSDLGLPEPVLAQAKEVMSFGPLTLPHELARLVLYEQLYRALSINAGINYHRAEFSSG